jgi:hypothetical protein
LSEFCDVDIWSCYELNFLRMKTFFNFLKYSQVLISGRIRLSNWLFWLFPAFRYPDDQSDLIETLYPISGLDIEPDIAYIWYTVRISNRI